MNALRRVWSSESGQAVVEAALCMPVLVLLLAAAIDLGRFTQFTMTLAGASHAGAQYGSQNATNAADLSGMETAATNDAPAVNVTASSYYKCADGSAPSTSSSLTMAATSSINCSANHKLLYVVVTVNASFKPLVFSFLTTAAHTVTAVMEVDS